MNYEKSVEASEPSSVVTTENVPCKYHTNMKFEFLVLIIILVLKYTKNLERFLGKQCA